MNETIYAIVESFKSITKWKISKIALITGLSIMSLWVVIGYIFWSPFVKFASSIVDLIPFDLIKTNGALLLSGVAFIQVIFITFAFIIIIFSYFIIEDAKKQEYPMYIVSIAFFVISFWSFIWFFNHDIIYDNLTKLLLWLPFKTVEKTMAYIFVIYIIYNLFVASLLLTVSFFSEKIISISTGVRVRKNSADSVMLHTFKNSVIFIAVSLITFVLLFIPVLNIITQIAVWIWLIKDTYTYDVATMFYSKEESSYTQHKHKLPLYIISFVASMFNFIPILNIFSPFFAEFAIYNYLEAYEE